MLMISIGLALILLGAAIITAVLYNWTDRTKHSFHCTPYTGPIYTRHGREIV